jgi:hypothetical protein
LPSFYSFSGSKTSIKSDVEWLLENSHFIFGLVDVKVCIPQFQSQEILIKISQNRTFDNGAPFDSDLIVQVIQSQWFPSSNRQKADVEAAAHVYKDQSIPVSMVLLAVSAVSNYYYYLF